MLAEQADVVLVGRLLKTLSNSNRLAELAQRMGRTFLSTMRRISRGVVKEAACVGKNKYRWRFRAPDILVQNVIARLREFGGGEAVTLEGREENIVSGRRKSCVDVREVEYISQFRNSSDDATLTRYLKDFF